MEKTQNKNDWKSLVQNFVANMVERIGDNVSQKVQAWVKMLKRKTIGALLMVFGLFYLLIGASVYLNSVLGKFIPGLGYITVGVLAVLIGYLVGNNKPQE